MKESLTCPMKPMHKIKVIEAKNNSLMIEVRRKLTERS
ncbi:hypothetical protein FTV88_2692 [Heliorestis convoluta]|uniref:Uncharacterized protein n=1 Tax=Heliorestis convoluta TaxID=356322 RepID=A0A5Q2N3A2_9FIRM|nr:hypothetical protein FTV88_2692 [Heliorestis convoluta]